MSPVSRESAPAARCGLAGTGSDPRSWTEAQLSGWLLERGLPDEIAHAFETHLVNGLLGIDLSAEDLATMGISDAMHQRRVVLELRKLFHEDAAGEDDCPTEATKTLKPGAPSAAGFANRLPVKPARPQSAKNSQHQGTRPSPYLSSYVGRRPRPRSAQVVQQRSVSPRGPVACRIAPAPAPAPAAPLTPTGGGAGATPRSCVPLCGPTAPRLPQASALLKQSGRIAEADRQIATLNSVLSPAGGAPPRRVGSPQTQHSQPLPPVCKEPVPAGIGLEGGLLESKDALLQEALRERDALRRELRAALLKFETKAESYGTHLHNAVNECEALRHELRYLRERCDTQEKTLAVVRREKEAAEQAYKDLCSKFHSTVAGPPPDMSQHQANQPVFSIKQRNANAARDQVLSIAEWRAHEFERRWRASESELDATRRALQKHLAGDGMVDMSAPDSPEGAVASVFVGACPKAPAVQPEAPPQESVAPACERSVPVATEGDAFPDTISFAPNSPGAQPAVSPEARLGEVVLSATEAAAAAAAAAAVADDQTEETYSIAGGPEPLDDLCEEFRLQVREMIASKSSPDHPDHVQDTEMRDKEPSGPKPAEAGTA